MAEFKSVDDFLNHRSSEGGGGARRFKSWKKDPGFLNIWLHTKQMPCSVWVHRIPELVVRQKQDSNEVLKNVWGRQHVCWEDESILKKQRFRDPETGVREHPPKKCGLCRLSEAIREMIADGVMKDTDVIFKFEGADDPKENIAIHAGGFCSLWGREVEDDDKERLKSHGIYLSKVFAESGVAKLNYVLAGVNHDDVAAGVQVAVETQLVGDKIKRTIRNEIASKDDEGNPFLHPYCMRLIAKPEEKKFDDKYDAIRIDRLKITAEIDRLIRGDKPSIAKYTTRFNQKTMRSLLEKHAVGPGKQIKWDQVFDVPQLVPDLEEGEAAEKPKASAQVPEKVTPPAPPKAEAKGPATIPCDDCKAPMLETDTKCAKCGAVYEIEEAPKASAPAAAPSPGASDEQGDGVYDDDPIPF